MSKTHDDARLRERAVKTLIRGIPVAPRRSSQSEALAVLHQLASSPSTATDAMAMLHELQVHQVELELQQEEFRRAQSELEAALVRQTALVERAPVGYMTVDATTVLCEINLAGAQLLGETRDALLGRPLASLLSAPSADALQGLLARARDAQPPETCALQVVPLAGGTRTVHAAADRDTVSNRFLLVLLGVAPR
jgi:PAS domain S-box-containing protein